MLKLTASLALFVTFSAPAEAIAGTSAAPAPEAAGGIVGLLLASGIVWLVRRGSSKSRQSGD